MCIMRVFLIGTRRCWLRENGTLHASCMKIRQTPAARSLRSDPHEVVDLRKYTQTVRVIRKFDDVVHLLSALKADTAPRISL